MKNTRQEALSLDDNNKNKTPTISCLGIEFNSQESRRQLFMRELKDYVLSSEWSAWPGKPRGEVEASLELSDPPYFVAGPNPFINRLVNECGFVSEEQDSRTPYAADISEGKSDSIYVAHGYHTKVPHRALVRYLLHYTNPGDVVLDGFAGTGMTGVAAQLCGSMSELQKMGYQIDPQGTVRSSTGEVISKFGHRFPVLCELSPSAALIAHTLNSSRNQTKSATHMELLSNHVSEMIEWAYVTIKSTSEHNMVRFVTGLESATSLSDVKAYLLKINEHTIGVNYWVWSHAYSCPNCFSEETFWDLGVDTSNGIVKEEFECPACKKTLTKQMLNIVWESAFDQLVGKPLRSVKSKIVLVNCVETVGNQGRKPSEFDHALAAVLEKYMVANHVPVAKIPKGDKTGEPLRLGINYFHQLYTPRNLAVLSAISGFSKNPLDMALLTAISPRASRQHQIAISRVGGSKAKQGGATAGHRRGTLYIPTNSVEYNAVRLLNDRKKAFDKLTYRMSESSGEYALSVCSAEATGLHDESVDYIFVDPPFGGNIIYSDLNGPWESWLGVSTNTTREAIESRSQKKSLTDYLEILSSCFKEFHRVLKTGKWISVEFHNSKNTVWNAIQVALQSAGFVIADVSILDKKIKTHTQRTARGTVNKDLVITAYKPSRLLNEELANDDQGTSSMWHFVSDHLKRLPIFHQNGDAFSILPERKADLLFDRYVAFHVLANVPVPLSAPEFYSGLGQYPQRDEMYFLPDQVTIYDRKRTTVGELRQLSIFITDEVSATQWIRQKLHSKPQTFQDLQPQFMQQLQSWAKHEQSIELKEILELNFFCYDGNGQVPSQIHSYLSTNFKELRRLDKGDASLKIKAMDRWYVPDPKKESDLEKSKMRTLLRQFDEYRTSTSHKIKEFRTEAVRAGFKHCYDEQDYQTIIDVAAKLPEQVIQEDEKLLMYYDVASMRLGR